MAGMSECGRANDVMSTRHRAYVRTTKTSKHQLNNHAELYVQYLLLVRNRTTIATAQQDGSRFLYNQSYL